MRLLFLCMIACIGLAASRSINSLESLEMALIDGDLECIDRHENIIKKYLLTKETCDSLRVPNFKLKTSLQRIGARVKRHFGQKSSADETDPNFPQVVAKEKGRSLFRKFRRSSGNKRSGVENPTEFSIPLSVIGRKVSKPVLSLRDRKRDKVEEVPRISRSPRHKLVSPFGSSASLKRLEELDEESQVNSLDDLGKQKGKIEKGNEKNEETTGDRAEKKEEKKEDEKEEVYVAKNKKQKEKKPKADPAEEEKVEKKEETAEGGDGEKEAENEYFSPGKEGDGSVTFVHATLLHHAVAAGASAIVHACLELGADPNVVNVYEETPLFAATDHSFELVRLLVKYGALPNVLNVDRETPLLSAASSGNELVAIELVLAGSANVTLTPNGKFSALAWAAQLQEWELVKVLVGAGADVNVCIMGGTPVLHLAVRACRPDVVRLLLEKGADPNAINKEYNTPLHILMYRLFKYFEADIEEDYDQDYFWNPVVREARRKQFNSNLMMILQMLLEAGANRHIVNSTGYTPKGIGKRLHRKELVAMLKGTPGVPSSDDSSVESK